MAKMIVYRVENWKGEGPYRAGYRTTSLDYLNYRESTYFHPLPYEDGIEHSNDHFFGFANFVAFYAWFGHTLRELSMNGCFLCEYEVDDRYVIKGKRQLAFRKDRAKLINRETI